MDTIRDISRVVSCVELSIDIFVCLLVLAVLNSRAEVKQVTKYKYRRATFSLLVIEE